VASLEENSHQKSSWKYEGRGGEKALIVRERVQRGVPEKGGQRGAHGNYRKKKKTA